ncbi:hypothetical protein [Microcoleus sp. PH2017_22_RUC_O_B]|uniref:hypothetical protein n=1 Tax=Microcoleus sp. PH2017_22_RUC_O_B TaxID=2798833 RepID=UPI0025ED3AAC|nr:hypothetical protein [Microcoleus sp. PH2017_22_RUC_O_B]
MTNSRSGDAPDNCRVCRRQLSLKFTNKLSATHLIKYLSKSAFDEFCVCGNNFNESYHVRRPEILGIELGIYRRRHTLQAVNCQLSTVNCQLSTVNC